MVKWKVLSSRKVMETKYMTVLDQRLRMHNGKIAKHYYIIDKKDVVIVFAVTKDKRVVLVNEYKHGAGKTLLQLPIGFMEKSEKPKQAALRELAEETGYTAKSAKLIGKYISSPSDMTNKLYLLFVRDAKLTGNQRLDETEEIEVITMPYRKVIEAVETGKIEVMPHIAAILMVKELLNKGKISF